MYEIKEGVNIEIINGLLKEGFCLVPSNIWDKSGKPKMPWWDWKKIDEPLTLVKLFDAIVASKADSVAVVGGEISASEGKFLVIVDIDTKYKKGVDAEIFCEIREVYPDLWEKLRLERTPSGGYHFYYRVILDGNGGLVPTFEVPASRLATKSELELKPRTPKYSFIEFKNVCQCYPSPGYELVREVISDLTWSEHCSIVQLLKDYDEIADESEKVWIKENKKNVIDIYEESPWADFNQGIEKDQVLIKCSDWKFKKKTGGVHYYIKPGKDASYKDDGAVYRDKNNRYKIYTTSSELDCISYTPVNLLCKVKFDGDKSSCFNWLVSEGYGKIKEYREKRIIKNSIARRLPLPANVSEKGKEEYKKEIELIGTKYPYETFWEESLSIKDGESKFNISRERLYVVAEKLGFSIRENGIDICFVSGDIVEIVDERKFFDCLKMYIKDAVIEIIDCFESFLQRSGKFTISRLCIFNEELVLKSTKETSYKFYKNGFVEVDSFGWEFKTYTELNGKLIWKHDIQDRDYISCESGKEEVSYYYNFLTKAIFGGISTYLLSCIGYYSHDYKATTTPYIVVLCETCENPAMGAGSGKNVFTNLLNFTSMVLNKPARHVKFDDTLLRTRKQQKIVSLNDAEKKFDYMGLRELSSGDGEVGKKYLQEQIIKAKDMPKFIVNTNFSFDPSLPGLKRRLIPIEFTEFFTRKGGVDTHYGIDFPTDSNSFHGWKESDWIGFDHIVLKSIQEFIKAGCKLTLKKLSDGGWTKQFCQRFGTSTFDFIKENIQNWIELGEVSIIDVFNPQKKYFYEENGITPNFQLGPIKMNEALMEYCTVNSIKFTAHKNTGKDLSGKQKNAKVFEILDGYVPSGSVGSSIESEIKKDDLPF